MRIISGRYKGKRIVAPKNINARPTTDFAKEGLFNILQNRIDIEAITVLDLFSGTGNIAFEFASRGAAQVTAVDISMVSHRFIQKTARELEFEAFKVIKSDAFRFLRKSTQPVDLIFADPPYGLENTENIPNLVFENKLLNENGLLIIEHPEEVVLSRNVFFTERRAYGKVNFSFFQG